MLQVTPRRVCDHDHQLRATHLGTRLDQRPQPNCIDYETSIVGGLFQIPSGLHPESFVCEIYRTVIYIHTESVGSDPGHCKGERLCPPANVEYTVDHWRYIVPPPMKAFDVYMDVIYSGKNNSILVLKPCGRFLGLERTKAFSWDQNGKPELDLMSHGNVKIGILKMG
ncbi:hypothetical protein BV898_02044 [Hypsibius exemplaris]|nr:hypothetical protein BV898_02044 [Hypsibius exemplaris]